MEIGAAQSKEIASGLVRGHIVSERASTAGCAVKYNNFVFNKYAKPTKCINSRASAVHGLTKENNDLYLRGVRVETSAIKVILQNLLTFLNSIGKLCILVAHNCSFDAPRLLLKIKDASLLEEFRKVVVGFTDTLYLFKKRFPDKNAKGALTLTTLAEELINQSAKNAHDAMIDVMLLEKLVNRFFTYDELVENSKTVDSLIENLTKEEDSKIYVQSLNPLKNIVSKAMIKRMAYAAISYEELLLEYQRDQKSVINLLEQRVDGKAQVIKSKKVLDSILNFLKNSVE